MSLSDPNTIPWSLIAAHLMGSADASQANELQAWRDEDPINESRYQEALRLWERSGQLGPEFPFDSYTDWPLIAARIQPQIKPLWQRPALRWAAVLLLLVGLSVTLWRVLRPSGPQWQEVYAQGEMLTHTLADGTKVTLREGGRLRFPSAFSDTARTIELSGEAWLQVTKDGARPFRIQGPDLSVEVLGTAFALRDFPNDGEGQVDLAEGQVKVASGESLILTSGQSAALIGDTLQFVPQNPYFLAWQQGELRFEATPLDEVLTALSRYYEQDFEVVGEAAADAQLTATFRDESIEEVKTILEIALGIEVK